MQRLKIKTINRCNDAVDDATVVLVAVMEQRRPCHSTEVFISFCHCFAFGSQQEQHVRRCQ